MSPDFEVKKEIPDKSFLGWASCTTAPLGVLAFWVGMLMASRRYPEGYDWRYTTVSHLLTPGRNPAGHLWATGGIMLCGLCGLCWAVILARRWPHESAEDQPSGIKTLEFGNVFMMCSAVLPEWLLRVHKGHEIFAVLAFAALCFGMVRLMFQTIERIFLRRMRGTTGRARLYAAIVASTAVLPILLAGLTQAYVYYMLPELHGANLPAAYLSFPFWEWVMCVVLSAYLVILSLATHVVYTTRKAGEGR